MLFLQSLCPVNHHPLFDLVLFKIRRLDALVDHLDGSADVLYHLGLIFEIDDFVHEELFLAEHVVAFGRNLFSAHVLAVGSVELILDLFYQLIR